MESKSGNSYFRYVDWFTVVIYLLLVIAGVFSVYAASYDFDNANILDFDEFSGKQVRWIFFALGLALMLLLIDARMYETYAFPVYVAVLIIMVVTIFVAPDIKGSRSVRCVSNRRNSANSPQHWHLPSCFRHTVSS